MIRQLIAGWAGVMIPEVNLFLSAGSVTITAEITVSDAAAATSVASTLSSGVFASASALEDALVSGGVTGITIVRIIGVTEGPASTSALNNGDSGTDSIIVSWTVIGVSFGVIGLGILYCVVSQFKISKPSPRDVQQVAVTTPSATEGV
jgi:hypothetical protein